MKCWNHIDTKEKDLVNELSDYINELENSQKIFLPDLGKQITFISFQIIVVIKTNN